MEYWRKRVAAFSYSFNGIYRLFRYEAHAQIHLCVAICVVIAGFLCSISLMEWCLIALCIGMVFATEGFNTAIEKLADEVTVERRPLIGAAKDIAAGAVLLAALSTIVVGLIIFIPKIFF